MLYFLLIVVVLTADQWTKYQVLRSMEPGQTFSVIEGVFHITFVRNYGAAFSLLQGKAGLIAVGAMVLIGALLAYLLFKRKSGHWVLLLSLSLIISGGIGNLIDRIRIGYVVDFFDFRIWPVFNVADIAVCCGCGLLLIFAVFIEPKIPEGNRKNKEGRGGDE